jgi:hypothetical protein
MWEFLSGRAGQVKRADVSGELLPATGSMFMQQHCELGKHQKKMRLFIAGERGIPQGRPRLSHLPHHLFNTAC